MIECACLVSINDSALLLARVRENRLWYLPGGKIEQGETHKETLCRELKEELSLKILPSQLTYKCTVLGPAYKETGLVKLICFENDIPIFPKPAAEVSEIKWMNRADYQLFAPAVKILFDKLFPKNDSGVSYV